MDFHSLPKSHLLMWKRTLSWMTSQKIIADVAATSSDVVDTITDVEMQWNIRIPNDKISYRWEMIQIHDDKH